MVFRGFEIIWRKSLDPDQDESCSTEFVSQRQVVFKIFEDEIFGIFCSESHNFPQGITEPPKFHSYFMSACKNDGTFRKLSTFSKFEVHGQIT